MDVGWRHQNDCGLRNCRLRNRNTPATTNIPGGRFSYAAWNDGEDDFWLFGGSGNVTPSSSGDLGDLWEAIPPTPTPAFSLTAGIYQGAQTLVISDAIGGAAIYYTTDGTAPTTSSPQYNGPITLGKTTTVQAIAVAAGRSQSLTRLAQYVIEAQIAITWEQPAPIAYGTPLSSLQLNAATSIPGSYVYTPDAGTVLPAGSNTLSVTFTPSDPNAAGFQAATASVPLQVNKSTPLISWVTPAPIAYGTALSNTQLDAAATLNGVTVPGTFTYTPVLGTVLTAGQHTLTVTFTPTDNTDYTTATASVTINVTVDTPTITWAKPAAITYGTALSATQLDATAVSGPRRFPEHSFTRRPPEPSCRQGLKRFPSPSRRLTQSITRP